MLKIQKTDKRMSGHAYFKYRVEMLPGLITSRDDIGWPSKIKMTLNFWNLVCKHMTEVYGYGPDTDKAYLWTEEYGAPAWGYRMSAMSRVDCLYFRDEEVLKEYQKAVTFFTLKFG